jgi:hypothetical protein
MNPVLSVGLPLYRAGEIAWLALESLCRQRDAPPWELLVLEEEEPPALGLGALLAYRGRLGAAGCVGLSYAALRERARLADKWARIAREATAPWLALQGGDDYAMPTRLTETWAVIEETPADWVQWPRGLFWSRRTGAVTLYDVSELQPRTGVEMAVRRDLVPVAGAPGPACGVDGWLLSSARRALGGEIAIACVRSESWRHAIHTDGWNVCSRERERMCARQEPPFSAWPGDLESVLPKEIVMRLLTQAGLRSRRP